MLNRLVPLAILGLLAACSQKPAEAPAPSEPVPPSIVLQPGGVQKKHIEGIATMPIAEIKRYLDECSAHGGKFEHPDVPYFALDCAKVSSRWDRRTMTSSSNVKPAKSLPTLH